MTLNATDLKIVKLIYQRCDDERIAARLGRPLSLELYERIQRLRKNPHG